MSDTAAGLEKTITYKLDDQEKEAFMSYGLLDELVRQVGDMTQVEAFFSNSDTRHTVLVAVLAERSKGGKITTKIDPLDHEIDIADVENILAWAAAHVTAFFISGLSKLTEQIGKLPTQEIQTKLAALLPTLSSDGSPA